MIFPGLRNNLNHDVKMIFLTGSNGLIGRELIAHLAGKYEIHALDLRNDCSFDYPESCQSKDKHLLIHLAWESLPSMGNSVHKHLADGDVTRSQQLLRRFASSSLKGKSIIFLSSSGSIYGSSSFPVFMTESSAVDPKSDYAFAKLSVEREISMLNVPSISLRCANAWGARIRQGRRNGLIDIAILNTILGHTTEVSVSPRSVISLVHVIDICKAIDLSIGFLGRTNSRRTAVDKYILNLSSESKSIQEITSLLSSTLGTAFVYTSSQASNPTYTKVSSEHIKNLLSWKASVFINKDNLIKCYKKYLDVKGNL